MSKTLENIIFKDFMKTLAAFQTVSIFILEKSDLLHFVSFLNKNYACFENGEKFGQNSQISAKPLIESVMELFFLKCIGQILEEKFSLIKSYLQDRSQ